MGTKRTNLILVAFVLCAVIIFVRSLDAAEVLISGVPAYLQGNFSGTQDCAPVASAMVLGYWDSFGYDKLVDAVGGGDGSSNWANNPAGVTALVNDLKVAEGWKDGIGTDIVGIRDGIKAVANNPTYGNEYSFNTENWFYFGADGFSLAKGEIDAGRPHLLTMNGHPTYQNHTVAVVGYRDTDSKLIVYDNLSLGYTYLDVSGLYCTLHKVIPGPPPGGAKTWDGGGANGNMSTAANWNGDSLPVAGDNLVIEYAGAQNNITADAGLAAVLAAIKSLTINVSATDGQDTSLTINTPITTTEGVTINIKGAGDLIITGASALTVGTTLDINHTGSTGTLGFGGTGTTSVTGAITVDTNASNGAGNITINRSGTWTAGSTTALTATGAGSITMTLGAASTFAGNVTLTAGAGAGNVILDLSTTNQVFNGALVLADAGGGTGVSTLDLGSGLHTLAGSLTNATDGVLIADSSTLTFDGNTDKTLTSSGDSFYNLTLNKAATGNTLILQDALNVDGKLTLTRGTLVLGNNLEHHFANDFEIQTDGIVTKGTGTTIVFDGITHLTDNSSGGPQDLGAIKVE